MDATPLALRIPEPEPTTDEKRLERALAQLRAANKERDEALVWAAEHAKKRSELQYQLSVLSNEHAALVHNLEARLATLIDTLRTLTAALPQHSDAPLKYFAGEPLVKANREAMELLRIIDYQKPTG